jgi:hypothetical protein
MVFRQHWFGLGHPFVDGLLLHISVETPMYTIYHHKYIIYYINYSGAVVYYV